MKKTILVIRDGWGYNPKKENNAIASAKTPNTDRLMRDYPNTLLECSGGAVGLPGGYQGNSEVGHLTIGSGRIIFQPMARIDKAIETGAFFGNEAFARAIENCKKNGTTLHLIGLLQSEGVHAHERHLYALLRLCKNKNFGDVALHVITDGRDAPPTEGIHHLERLLEAMAGTGVGRIATISGRYYAMDRDKRWDRTKQAYDCIVRAQGPAFGDARKFMADSYAKGVTDEFLIPHQADGYGGIRDRDSVIVTNFRTDRPRQLTRAMVENAFEGWDRKPLDICCVTMTEYYKPMNATAAFEDQKLENLLGDVISREGIGQLRISETEKYAHVTFFFNGQQENPGRGEQRILVPSPKVATYDLQPEMSAFEVTEKLVDAIEKGVYGFIVVNIVNGDLVGHTGVRAACIKAAETVDACVGKITEAGLGKGYTLLVFADHGNLEDQSPEWRTSHTLNPVPLILVSEGGKRLRPGGLQDIAPTVLDIMGIAKPAEMTGESLLVGP